MPVLCSLKVGEPLLVPHAFTLAARERCGSDEIWLQLLATAVCLRLRLQLQALPGLPG